MKLRIRLTIVALTVVATVILIDRALTPVLRRRPQRVMRPMRRMMRWLNTVYLGLSERFNFSPSVVYHTGRTSGREYATPLCVSSTTGGFVVPAAFGPEADGSCKSANAGADDDDVGTRVVRGACTLAGRGLQGRGLHGLRISGYLRCGRPCSDGQEGADRFAMEGPVVSSPMQILRSQANCSHHARPRKD